MADPRRGWQAYHKGNHQRAAQIFDRMSGPEALTGKAVALAAMGRSTEAVTLVEHQLQQSPSPQLKALLADIKGRQGNRSEAERILSTIAGSNGFVRTLLGEQRIRLGRWSEGTDDFIAGIDTGDERAFDHTRRVVTDMIDAVAARRIPQEDAAKFINRIDYSTSRDSDAVNHFFAEARRSLNANRRLDRSGLVEPWSRVDMASTSTSTTSGSSSGPPPTRTPGSASSSTSRSTTNRPPGGGPPPPETPAPEPDSTGNSPADIQKQLSQGPERPDAKQQLIEANQKNMAAVMERERGRNERLQDLPPDAEPPNWPSNYDTPIDAIEPIGFSATTILPGSNEIETANFRLTGGDIGVEITLERCMHNLIAAALSVKPVTLPQILASIPRLELNLVDGFLDEMPELSSLYRNETEVENPKTLGVGKFLGECIVRTYGGVWEHDIPARNSRIHLGDHVLDPIGLAERFLATDDFDDVDLRSLIDEAAEAVKTSTGLPVFSNHIDPTSSLADDALPPNLAELWVGYRFVLPDTELQPIASSIEVLESNDEAIVYSIGVGFVPAPLVTNLDGIDDGDGRCRMAYLRESGEMLVLASRKHFGRFLEGSNLELDQETASEIAGLTKHLFRPGWSVLVDPDRLAEWRRHFETDELEAPSLYRERGRIELALHAVDEKSDLRKIVVSCRQTDPLRYAIRVD